MAPPIDVSLGAIDVEAFAGAGWPETKPAGKQRVPKRAASIASTPRRSKQPKEDLELQEGQDEAAVEIAKTAPPARK